MSEATMEKTADLSPKDYKSTVPPTWCAGCGDYGVLNSAYKAFSDLKLDINNSVLVSGIGCSSRFPYFVKTYGVHSVHGRALPVAAGVKLGNPNLEVIVFGGDGDGFSIGGGHVPHIARKNTDISFIMMDNHIYGLTKGQVSPTSNSGFVTVTTPYGSPDPSSVNPIAYCLTYGATFVAQGFAGNPKQLTDLMKQAIQHKGFSFVNVISPCPTYNKLDTFNYYKPLIGEIPASHDSSNLVAALAIATQGLDGKVPTGVFYKTNRPTLLDNLREINVKAKANDKPDFQKIFADFNP